MRRFCFTTLLIFSLFVCENVIQAQDNSEIITVKGTITDTEGRKIRRRMLVTSSLELSQSRDGQLLDYASGGVYKKEVESDGTIYFFCDGYYPQKIEVKGRSKIDVVLEKDKRIFISISGRVTDEEGNPLEKVLITQKQDSENLTSPSLFYTEEGGRYRDLRISDESILTFSLDGYETQTVAVDKRDEINIVLKKLKD